MISSFKDPLLGGTADLQRMSKWLPGRVKHLWNYEGKNFNEEMERIRKKVDNKESFLVFQSQMTTGPSNGTSVPKIQNLINSLLPDQLKSLHKHIYDGYARD